MGPWLEETTVPSADDIYIPQRTPEEIAESRIGPIRFASTMRYKDRPKAPVHVASAQHALLAGALLSGLVLVRLFILVTGLDVSLQGELTIGLILGVVPAVIVFWRLSDRQDHSGFRWHGPMESVARDDDRLVVVGGAAPVCTVGPLEPTTFPPQHFDLSHVLRRGRLRRFVSNMLGFVTASAVAVVVIALTFDQRSLALSLLLSIVFTLLGDFTMGLAVHLETRLFPVFLRIEPGRMAVIRYGFCSNEVAKTETFDLSTARVVVDADREVVGITDGDRRIDLGYAGVRNKRFVPYCVLLGAISADASEPTAERLEQTA